MIGPFVVLFGLMAVGFVATKMSWINEMQNQGLGNVLINITFPCLMFSSVTNVEIQGDFLGDFIKMFFLSFFFFFLFGQLGGLYAKIAKLPNQHHGMVKLSMLTSNNGFMGFPIVLAFFGQMGFILMVANNIVMAVMTFGYGIRVLKKSRRQWEGHEVSEKFSFLSTLKQIFNPIISTVLLALLVNFACLGQYVPGPLSDLISTLGSMTTPLSMIYIGATLAASPLKDLFHDRASLMVSIVRLTLFSTIVFLILKFLPLSLLIKQVLYLVYVLPSAAIVPVLTERYGAGHKESVNIVVISTLLSLITTPLGVYIALNFF